VLEGELHVERGRRRIEDTQPLRYDLGADSIAGDDGDAMGGHGLGFLSVALRVGSGLVDGVVGGFLRSVENVDDRVLGLQTCAGAGFGELAGVECVGEGVLIDERFADGCRSGRRCVSSRSAHHG